jgi:hypothetical protein
MAILATLAFVLVLVRIVGIDGAALAGCVATNCAIDEEQATTPTQDGDTGADLATTPKLANALKELGNATVRALRNQASATSRAISNKASATSRALNSPCGNSSSAAPEQTESPPPAASCAGSNC